jgi:hypothetical protein
VAPVTVLAVKLRSLIAQIGLLEEAEGEAGIGVTEIAKVLVVLEQVPAIAVTCKFPEVAALEKLMEMLLVLPVMVAPVPV